MAPSCYIINARNGPFIISVCGTVPAIKAVFIRKEKNEDDLHRVWELTKTKGKENFNKYLIIASNSC